MSTSNRPARSRHDAETRRWEEPAILLEHSLVAHAHNRAGAIQDPFMGPLGLYGPPKTESPEFGS